MSATGGVDPPFRLPPGGPVELPGRGTTFVRRVQGPPAAPTLVLLHGWTVSADLNWFLSYRALSQHFQVITIDHRGHGRGIRSRRRFRLADCADDVAALADVLGVERVIPVGYSMGGPIAMLTWHRHRDRVDGLVLCATAPYFSDSPGERAMFSMLPALSAGARLAPGAFRQQVADRLLSGRFEENEVGRWATEELRRSDPVKIMEAGGALGRFDARPWLAEIDVPTAVVRTLHDNVVPPSRQTLLARSIPDALVVDVAADHGACVRAADRFVPGLVRAARHVAAARRPRAPEPPRPRLHDAPPVSGRY